MSPLYNIVADIWHGWHVPMHLADASDHPKW